MKSSIQGSGVIWLSCNYNTISISVVTLFFSAEHLSMQCLPGTGSVLNHAPVVEKTVF